MCVRGAVLVCREERLVPLVEVLSLREQSLKLGIYNLGHLRWQWLGESIQCLAETEKLNVKGWVGSINCMGGREALERERIFACEPS